MCNHHWLCQDETPATDAVCLKCGETTTFTPQTIWGNPLPSGMAADLAFNRYREEPEVKAARRESELDIWVAQLALEGRRANW